MKLNAKWLLFVFLVAILALLSCNKKAVCETCNLDNIRPVVKGGTDTIIALPTYTLLLDGSSSYDPDGNVTNYEWSAIPGSIAGPVPAIRNNNEKQTVVAHLSPGIYRFELKVTDNKGGHSF